MATTHHTTTTTVAHGTHPAHGGAVGHDVAHHQHGSMDVADHQRTFNGFVRFMMWNAIAVIAVLIFMALANA